MISCQELSRNNNVASVFFALWRHLEACKLLGWTEVEVIVQSTSDAETEVLMEIAENEQRKSFSREERVNAGVELERIEKALADTDMTMAGERCAACRAATWRSAWPRRLITTTRSTTSA